MPSDYARRGRPRGSGLDDRVTLERIVELLDADPSLKPTTAIKAIGVSDPSTIRRLRDKLKAPQSASHGSFGGQPSADVAPLRAETQTSRRAVPAGRRDHAGGAALHASMDPVPFSDAQLSWLARWCALGLHAMSSTVEAQMAILDDILRVPPVESALRQQLMFNEVAKAFCPKRSGPRTSLH